MLYPRTSSKCFTYYYPGKPVHTNTFSTPQGSIQPEHILGTNLAQVQKTKRTAGFKPTISWLRVQCLDHLANCPP